MHQPYVWEAPHTSAFCFTIDVDAESPQLWRARTTGITGLNQLEQRRYGMRQGIWNLLQRLQTRGVKATCFVPFYEITTYPWLLETLTSHGHEIGLHGCVHETVTDLSTERFREIMEESLEAVSRITGTRPRGFRSPSWEMTPAALRVLGELGLFDSSLSGYDHPYEWDGVVELPIQWPLDDAVFFRHIGGGADYWPPEPTTNTTSSWLHMARALHQAGGLCVSTVHPWLSGRTGRLDLVDALLEHATSTEGLWVTTASQVAAYHTASINKSRYMANLSIPPFPAP